MLLTTDLSHKIDNPLFHLIGETADALGIEAYVVGGYVRDLLLHRPSSDIDVVSVGKGIDLAREFAKAWGKRARLSVFQNFGTAQVKRGNQEIEFVGARKESYHRDSRNPVVEDATLEEDLERRDFTINAMAVCLNSGRFGELVDLHEGLWDLEDCLLRTPTDPFITFSDDPLRMMRGIRFASELGFSLDEETFDAIKKNCRRIGIISKERICVEFNKILLSPRPSIGLELMERTGLMEIILPELFALKGAETQDGIGHKDNLTHTYKVVDNLAKAIAQSEKKSENGEKKSTKLFLLWAALLHDIGKPQTKRFEKRIGWTFHNHDFVGAKMIPPIFKRLKLPLDGKMNYVRKLVQLHMRPATLAWEGVTDSAIRRLLFDAGDDIEDLMMLVDADITSKNPLKVNQIKENYRQVKQKLVAIEEKDRIRNFQPPVSGEEIMRIFGLPPSKTVGILKEAIKTAILDGEIANDYNEALRFMLERASEMGLKPDPSRS